MVQRILILVMAALLLNGCATYHDTKRERMNALPQRYSQFDLVLAWDTRVVDGNTYVEGVVKDVRWAFMYDLEIWIAVIDPEGKVLARSMTFVIPNKLNQDEIVDFDVKLPVPVAPGAILRFTYKYRGSDGGDDGGPLLGGGMPWMQSFDAVVPPLR